jgi:hypothetical protein
MTASSDPSIRPLSGRALERFAAGDRACIVTASDDQGRAAEARQLRAAVEAAKVVHDLDGVRRIVRQTGGKAGRSGRI